MDIVHASIGEQTEDFPGTGLTFFPFMMKIVYFSLRNPDAQSLFCANFAAYGTDNFQRNGQPVF